MFPKDEERPIRRHWDNLNPVTFSWEYVPVMDLLTGSSFLPFSTIMHSGPGPPDQSTILMMKIAECRRRFAQPSFNS